MAGYVIPPLSTPAAPTQSKSGFHWFQFRRYRWRMSMIMLAADLFGWGAAGASLFLLNYWAQFFIFQWHDLTYFTISLICLVLFLPTKLYPGIGLNPAEEIRLVAGNTLLGFLLGAFVFGLDGNHWYPNYFTLLPFALLSVGFVLIARWLARMISVRHDLWGAPMVVIGSAADASHLAQYFHDRRRLGLIPRYAVICGEGDREITAPVSTLRIGELLNYPDDFFAAQQVFTALLDFTNVPEVLAPQTYARLSALFPRLILVSNLNGMQNSSFRVHDFEGIVGVEASKNVLTPLDTFIKRTMDIVGSLLLLAVTLPLWALAAIIIRINSPGPIFFTQLRVGQNRRSLHDRERTQGHVRKIKVYKFRTMVIDAEQKLHEYLEANPAARREWANSQKLKDDPRIIRGCHWLRKFSVDELPQLINVFKGEMSLVGPRPITIEQIPTYGDRLDAYHTIRPGLTGLWQVSGRNHTTFDERAAFDEYYVHNWLAWLDLYILLRTVWVVLSRDGAY